MTSRFFVTICVEHIEQAWAFAKFRDHQSIIDEVVLGRGIIKVPRLKIPRNPMSNRVIRNILEHRDSKND